MQEGGSFFRKLVHDAGSVVGVDSRPLLFAFAMCAGAAVYLTTPIEPTTAEICGLVVIAAGVLFIALRQSTADLPIAIASCIFGLVLGYSAGAVRAIIVKAPMIESETRPVMLEGWVSNVEAGEKGARLRINVFSIAGLSEDQLPNTVRVTHRSRLEVSPGRFVRCWVVLRPPPSPTLPGDYDFRRQAYFQQLGAVGYVQGRCRGGALGPPNATADKLELWIAAQRRNLAVYVKDASGEGAGGLAAALVTGDRSFLSPEDQTALRETGLAHLLAISGLHLSIVGGLTFFLVRRTLVMIEPLALRVPVQKPAAIAALIACATYLVVSGASVSTQRAFIMAAIIFLAVIFDRAAISLRTFAIALIAVVLLQPESVVTPGFQMSFAATGGLIAAYEVWRNHRSTQEKVLGPISFALASIIMTSVVSDMATAPFSFFHFERLSPVGLFANFAIMPVVTFVTAPCAALAVVLAVFGQAELGLQLLGQSLELVLHMTHFFHDQSPGVFRLPVPMPPVSLVFLSLSLAAMMAFTGWMRFFAGVILFIPAVWAWMDAPRAILHWSASGDVFIADETGRVGRLEYADGDGLAPLRFSEAPDLPICTGPQCEYRSVNGLKISVEGQASREVASDSDGQPPIPPVLDRRLSLTGLTTQSHPIEFEWEAVRAAGGVTVYEKEGAVRVAQIPPCTGRAWRPCPVSSSDSQRPGGIIDYIKRVIRSGE